MLLSGFPPSGGVALPPNRLVMRRMNVDFPHPESAARPIITGPSRLAVVTTRARFARVVVARRALTGVARTAVAKPRAADIIHETRAMRFERGTTRSENFWESFRWTVRDVRRRGVSLERARAGRRSRRSRSR